MLLNLVELFLGTLAFVAGTLRAEACLVVDRASHLVPQLEEEASVVWFVDDRDGVVAEVLEGGVDEGGMCIQRLKLESPVEVHSVSIEEEREHGPKQVEVDWHDQGDNEHRCGSHKLIHPFVSNNSKRAWVVEGVVVFVDVPEELKAVTNVVVRPFKEISSYPQHKEAENMILPRVSSRTTERVGHLACAEVEGHSRTERCNDDPL